MEKVFAIASQHIFGGFDNLLKTLLIMMMADILTGIIKAVLGKSEKSANGFLDSQIMWDSGLKKITILIVICISVAINRLISPDSPAIRNATVLYYIAVEALSSLENAVACGLPMPEYLKNVLEKIKDKKE